MQNYILYRAGSIDRINECRYSLLKYLAYFNLHPPAHTKIIIYTDQPAAFEAYAPYFPHFEMKQFGLKKKAELLYDAMKEEEGNFLYMDTATYVSKELDALFRRIEEGVIYLVPEELSVKNEMVNVVKSKKLSAIKEAFDFSSIPVWSTVSFGISSRGKEVVREIMTLTYTIENEVRSLYAEQIALSYYFREHLIRSPFPGFYEYLSFPSFTALLRTFFQRNEEENIPNLVKLTHVIDPAEIKKSKEAYDKQPFYKKWLNKLTGKTWDIKTFEKKF